MVAHTGICHVHRAELMTLGGAWEEALGELRRLGERLAGGMVNQRAMGQAAYQQGEVLRLRGEFDAAEAAYREASRLGREPQPGLALLRLAQGNAEAAAASIRRAVGEAAQPLKRAALLPAYVEIALAAEDVEAARVAWRELEEIAGRQGSDALVASAAQAEGAVRLAEGDADAALTATRRAWNLWEELKAPYEAARARVLVGLACRRAGRRGHGRTRARGSAAGLHRAGSGSRPGVARLAHRAARARRHGRPDGARARGAAPGGGREEQPGDRRGADHQRAHRRPPPPEHLRQAPACRPAPPRARSRSSTTWSEQRRRGQN